MDSLISLFNDLISLLPWGVKSEWESLGNVSPERPTVILVAGFGAGSRAVTVLRRRLISHGYNVLVLAFDFQSLSDSFRGLYRLAEKLSSMVTQLKKRGGMRRGKIYLVAHSAGGLVARYYVQRLGGWHYCDGLVTLGAPHCGTWIAALGFVSPLIVKARILFQMMPFSPFIKALNRSTYPSGFPLVSVVSPNDLLCPPSATALPPELLGREEVKSISVPHLSHGEFLMSKRSYAVLLKALQQLHNPTPHVEESPTQELRRI